MSELESCPFCGGQPFCVKSISVGYKIGCDNPQCPIQPETITYGSSELAEKAWNTRAEMPEKNKNQNTP